MSLGQKLASIPSIPSATPNGQSFQPSGQPQRHQLQSSSPTLRQVEVPVDDWELLKWLTRELESQIYYQLRQHEAHLAQTSQFKPDSRLRFLPPSSLPNPPSRYPENSPAARHPAATFSTDAKPNALLRVVTDAFLSLRAMAKVLPEGRLAGAPVAGHKSTRPGLGTTIPTKETVSLERDALASDNAVLLLELDRAFQDNERLKSEIKCLTGDNKPPTTCRLQPQADALSREYAALTRDRNQWMQDMEHLASKIEHLHGENAAFARHQNLYRQDNEDCRKHCVTLRENMARVEKERMGASREHDTVKLERDFLLKECLGLREECYTYRHERDTLKTELENLCRNLAGLQNAMQSANGKRGRAANEGVTSVEGNRASDTDMSDEARRKRRAVGPAQVADEFESPSESACAILRVKEEVREFDI